MNPDSINADFPGAATPPGSRVEFSERGRSVAGVVAKLLKRHAVVAAGAEGRWKVPYELLRVVERAPKGECTLADVEELARRLFARHRRRSGLGAEWTFGFDLSTARAGVCREQRKRIDLSVCYCLRATRDEIEDTLLHEIAHAIVGVEHRHDAVWRAKAREIGCTAERCSSVGSALPRWIGSCGCERAWSRQRLSRALREDAICKACRQTIVWRVNADGQVP